MVETIQADMARHRIMSYRIVMLGSLLGGIGILAWISSQAVTPMPLRHEAYVWQRSWDDALGEAVIEAGATMSAMLCLAAEITTEKDQLRTRHISVDHHALNRTQGRPVAVVRVFPSVAAKGWSDDIRTHCDETLRTIVARWSTEHPNGFELQIDFDCPESRLAEFHQQMRHWKSLFPTTRLTFTALPTWVSKPEFPPLAREFPDYVLQVHSLHLPSQPDDPTGLYDPSEIYNAAQAASLLRIPYRLALPTYSCLVVFDEKGGVAEVYSEDLPDRLPINTLETLALDSDAHFLSKIVRDWERSRPEGLNGIVWYRLPSPQDRLNWDWNLLSRVIDGTPLFRSWSLRLEPDPVGYQRLILQHTGTAPDNLPDHFQIRVPRTTPMGADGLEGYVYTALPESGRGNSDDAIFVWHLAEPGRHFQKPPGWSATVGWCRWEPSASTPEIELPAF